MGKVDGLGLDRKWVELARIMIIIVVVVDVLVDGRVAVVVGCRVSVDTSLDNVAGVMVDVISHFAL